MSTKSSNDLWQNYLHKGKQAVVGVAGAAPSGRSPGGGAPTTPLTAGATVSRNSVEGYKSSTVYDHIGALPEADRLTWDLGQDYEGRFGLDRNWRYQIFRRYPEDISVNLARKYLETYKKDGRVDANWELIQAHEVNKSNLPQRYYDEDELKNLSERLASQGRQIGFSYPINIALHCLARMAAQYNVSLPQGKTEKGTLRRLACNQWWLRKLRSSNRRIWETVEIFGGRVHKHSQIYASEYALRSRRSQKAEARELLRIMEAVNETGERHNLLALSQSTVSNPRIKRAELMARLAGFERFAQEHDHTALFLTLTVPGRMHACYAKTGKKNPRFCQVTPRESQAYLNQQWRKIRAKFKRQGIQPYGFRIAEPQHDGTPHWHLLLFVRSSQSHELTSIMRHYALEVDGDEPGAKIHRLKCVEIDWSRGTATGYVAKYVSKNIDGYQLDGDLEGKDAKSSSERVDAWASTWGIRQFQQIGGPSVGVWRELRRLREPLLDRSEIEACRAAADSGDWYKYLLAQGGANLKKSDYVVKVLYCWTDELNIYGESKGYSVIGVCSYLSTVTTRHHIWFLRLTNRDCIEGKAGFEVPLLDISEQIAQQLALSGSNSGDFLPLESCQ